MFSFLKKELLRDTDWITIFYLCVFFLWFVANLYKSTEKTLHPEMLFFMYYSFIALCQLNVWINSVDTWTVISSWCKVWIGISPSSSTDLESKVWSGSLFMSMARQSCPVLSCVGSSFTYSFLSTLRTFWHIFFIFVFT